MLCESFYDAIRSCITWIVGLQQNFLTLQTGGASWQVPLGRRDGLVSRASDTASLPGFNEPINALITKFADKNLNTQDLVTLSGKLNVR